jgi:hypothetical protein
MSQETTPAEEKNDTETNISWFPEKLTFLDEGIPKVNKKQLGTDRIRIVVGESGTLKSRIAYSFLAHGIACHKRGTSGVVLLTSEGFSQQDLIDAIKEWNAGEPDVKQVLVNPISPRFLSSSNFVFHLRLSIRAMKKKLECQCEDAYRIRVVIDNWNSIIDAHASLQKDDQLLQEVLTVLREEGVLAMIVATQSGSPAAIADSNRKHDVTCMEVTRIHCWPVNFFGDRRIAVSTSIPGKDGKRTSVAEIGRFNGSDFRLEIKTDFDLYEDLESGKAKRVKLKVRLYSGYDDVGDNLLPASSSYEREVSALFGDLFSRSESRDDVVTFEGTKKYDSFKEYIQNLDREQLDETLVFQVDEFWSGKESNSSFAKVSSSFFKEQNLSLDKDSFPDSVFNRKDEPGLLRVPLHKDFGILLADRAAWYKAREMKIDDYWFTPVIRSSDAQAGEEREDLDFYIQAGLDLDGKKFDYTSMPLHPSAEEMKSVNKKAEPVKVGDVWNALCVDGASFDPRLTLLKNNFFNPSWQMFLRACEIVALESGKRPFDVDLRTSESLSCLILEIWISRIVDRNYLKDDKRSLRKVCEDTLEVSETMSDKKIKIRRRSLRELVGKYMDDFIFALRTAIRFLPGRYREQKLSLSPPDLDAVTVRTWVAGAVHCQIRNRNLTPLRVPGKFCIRGDWYLAVAKGSRSMRLAESAMAKLLSESMNRKRLREGIGLPVLKSTLKDNLDNVESALKVPDPNLSSHRPLKHHELKKAEPQPLPDEGDSDNVVKLVRLFRSEIEEYDATSEQFQLLIASLLRVLHPASNEELSNVPKPETTTPSDEPTPHKTNSDPWVDTIIKDFIGEEKQQREQLPKISSTPSH